MRKQFWHLYKKELREGAPFAIVLGILIAGLLIFLTVMKARWGADAALGLSFTPLGIIPFYVLFQGFTAFRSEWKEDTIFTVMSLPVPGWFFCATKLFATMTYFTLMTILNVGLAVILNWGIIKHLFENIPNIIGLMQIVKVAILMYLVYWLLTGISYIIGQFSFLTSRLVNKGKALIGGLTALTTFWLFFRLGGFLTSLLSWLPDLNVGFWNYQNGFYHTQVVAVDVAPWLALILVSGGLIYLGAWLLERILEV